MDYLLIFDGGGYKLDPAAFAIGVEAAFPAGRVQRPLPSPDDEGAFARWTFGTGDEKVDGRISSNGDAVFAHARDVEMARFTEWVRSTVPPEVEVLLTNDVYSFTAVIPNGADAAEITALMR